MSVLRFLFLAITSALLVILISCSQNPSVKETATPAATQQSTTKEIASHSGHSDGKAKININTAILSELDKLEAKLGVPALSNKIQASRPYAKPDELVSKKVITQEQFDQVKDLVTIEDVVLTGEAKDVDYMTKLGLMKGHLLVAKELLDLQKPDQAEPHIGHPVEEIYADVEDQLKERKVKEFKTTLIGLQDLVKSNPKNAKVSTNFEASMQSVDGGIAALPETQRQSPQFVLKVINALLESAKSEYGAAVSNGKVSAAIEYQDSRGFVTYANSLYKNISGKMAKEQPEVDKALEANIVELTKIWPTAIAPPAPVKTPDQVSELIKKIEEDTQKVIKQASGA